MINKKILKILAMGVIFSNISPIIANATSIEYDRYGNAIEKKYDNSNYDKYGHSIENNYDKRNYDKYGHIIDVNGNVVETSDNNGKPANSTDNNNTQNNNNQTDNTTDADELSPIGNNKQNPLFTITDYVVPSDSIEPTNVNYNFNKLYTEKYNKGYEDIDVGQISGNGSVRDEELLAKYPVLVHVSKSSMVPVNYSNRTTSKINKALKLLQEANDEKSVDKLSKAVNVMSNLVAVMPNDEIKLHVDKDQIDYFYIEAIYLGFELTNDGAERNKYFSTFMDNSYISIAKRYNNGLQVAMLEKYTNYLGWHLDGYFSETQTKNILQAGASIMFSMSNSVLSDQNILSILRHELEEGFVFDETEPPSVLIIKPKYDYPDSHFIKEIPKSDNPTTVAKPDDYTINYDGEFFIAESTDFLRVGDGCHKVVYRYDKDGTLISSIDETLDKSYNAFCGIGEESDIKIEDWNAVHDSRYNLADDIWGAMDDTDKNKDSNRTLQFTLDKTQEVPYYYDSGLKASTNDTVTFNQIKSLFNQIFIKAKGYVVNDKDKVLLIVDGKPIVAVKKESGYTVKDIEDMFAPLSEIGVKIDDIKTNRTDIDTALMESNLKQFRLHGDIIKLSNPITTEGKSIQMPIAELGKNLGYTVEESNNKVVLKRSFYGKDIEIEYTEGTAKVEVNGTKIVLDSTTRIEDDVLYADATMVVRTLGLGIYFDEKDNFTEIK